ncbi:hypothetical protein LCGC14_3001000, partial [marine sediment metagenome]
MRITSKNMQIKKERFYMSEDEQIDEELAKAKQSVLADLLGKKQAKIPFMDTRSLTKSQATALKALENEKMFEIVDRVIDYGDPDPITKQVQRFSPQRKGLVMTVEVYPEEKRWIEHLLLILKGVPLKNKEVDLVKKNINLGKGASGDGIEWASVSRGDNLGVVFDEDEKTVTHFTLSVLV